MTKNVTVAVDAMGGDRGVDSTVEASLNALDRHVFLHIMLLGDEEKIRFLLRSNSSADMVSSRLNVVHCEQQVGMEEKPASALRNKMASSMWAGLDAVRTGQADGMVSAGNTGALMAMARYVLKTLPGIDRPAMIKTIPTVTGTSLLLDVGANVDCSADHLFQFAVMGSLMAELAGIPSPKVALLNIGTESNKGNQLVKLAATLLERSTSINFVGSIEADAFYRGESDVVVCDGFSGNVLLKASEGLTQLMFLKLKQLFDESLGRRVLGSLSMPLLRQVEAELKPAQHNGASFIGLHGVVVKSHGSADVDSFGYAIDRTIDEIFKQTTTKLHERLAALP